MTDPDKMDERLQVLSSVLTHVLATQEDERRTVIHTLQEDVGQALTALALNLRVLERHGDRPPRLELVGEMRELVAGALRDLDHLQRTLYPPALDSQGLIPAMETCVQEFAHSTQVRVALDAEVMPVRLPKVIEIALFRSLQEVLEHLREQPTVSEVRLRLRFIKEFAYLVIEADGATRAAGWREDLIVARVAALGGCYAITPSALTGTHYAIALPVYQKESP